MLSWFRFNIASVNDNSGPLGNGGADRYEERLRLLAWGFYFKGGLGALFISFLLIHFTLFLGMSFIPQSAWEPKRNFNTAGETVSVTPTPSPSPTPRPVTSRPRVVMFRIFAAVIGAIILLGWTFGALTIYAGRCLQKRERRGFIFVMAALNCALFPWGTLLGIATFIVLPTPAARREFGVPVL